MGFFFTSGFRLQTIPPFFIGDTELFPKWACKMQLFPVDVLFPYSRPSGGEFYIVKREIRRVFIA
jgi:hypothetical protein